jgi:hypothetical protein
MTYDNKSKAPVASEGYDMVITTIGLVNSIATNGEWSWKEGEGNSGVAFHAVNIQYLTSFLARKGPQIYEYVVLLKKKIPLIIKHNTRFL